MILPQKLSHHASLILPYHKGKDGVEVILEKKSPCYVSPYFNEAYNLLGGNWKKGMHNDKTPKEVMTRELDEEFWKIPEEQEAIDDIIYEGFCEQDINFVRFGDDIIEKIMPIHDILVEDNKRNGDFIISVPEPIVKEKMYYITTVYTRQLNDEEYNTIKNILDECYNIVTTDNLNYSSFTEIKSFEELNSSATRYAWGTDKILNSMMPKIYISDALRETTKDIDVIDISHNTCFTFKDYEHYLDVQYEEKK